MILRLPYPPSVNHYWRKGKSIAGRSVMYVSKEGQAFRGHVAWIVAGQRVKAFDGLVHVHMDAWPPDRRERDGDNLWKATLDAIVWSRALAGDSNRYIQSHSMQWHPPTKDAHVIITITPIGTANDKPDPPPVGVLHPARTARRS